MKTSNRLAQATLGMLTLTMAPAAFAYLDPGTGSVVLQMVIAGALGAMFYIKTAWAGTKAYLSRLFGGDAKTESIDEASDFPGSENEPNADSAESPLQTGIANKAE